MLDFSPGPIHAEDEDKEMSSSVSYSILSGMKHAWMGLYRAQLTSGAVFVLVLGNEDGRFRMDTRTGEMKLIKRVTDRLKTPLLHLQVMVRLS